MVHLTRVAIGAAVLSLCLGGLGGEFAGVGRAGDGSAPASQPGEEAKRRAERAAELVEKAGKAGKPLEALALLNEAAQSDPQSIEIRFAIATACFRLKREREFGTAMGDVLKIDPDQPAAMNNLAVLLAASKTWPTSLRWSTQAARHSDSELVLANLEQIAALAAADKCLDPALATAQAQIHKTVENIHKAGAHADEARWCGQWISQADYNAFIAGNKAFDMEIAKLRDRIAKLQASYQQAKSVVDNYESSRQRLTDDKNKPGRSDRYRRDIDAQLAQLAVQRDQAKDFIKQAEQDGGELQEQLRDMIGRKFIEGFAGRLVLLQADARTELAVVSVDRDRREKRLAPGKPATQPDNEPAPGPPAISTTRKE